MNETRVAEPPPVDRYRMLVDAITDYAVFMVDPHGRVANWNPGAQRFKGYRPDEIIGQHFSRFYTEEDKARGLPAMALETAARDGKFEAEGWRIRKDGSRFWAHVVIDPILAPDGEILGYAKITRDLSDRRAAEQALRHSEEQFRLLVQSVSDYAIYMLDLDGNVSSWNAGAERIKGYRPDEIIGQHFSRFYTEADRAAGLPEKALEQVRRTGRFAADGRRVRRDGTEFQASVVMDTVRDDNGQIVGFAKITRDVTERETALQDLAVAREALFQSQKMDAIGQLTGGVAHDFNNLLMAVLGSLELLRKRMPQDPGLLRLLDNAAQGAERGATLTQRMLAFARRQELDAVRVEIGAMVAGMADLLQHSLGVGWSIETHFPPGVSAVHADINQLEMALLNLVVNARDAMPDGGVIRIETREARLSGAEAGALAEGDYVCLSVRDSGIGMDAQTLDQATQPFFTTKGVGKGTGLGLAMIHGFTAQLGGRFVLKSTLGKGTTAEIWLPVTQDDGKGAIAAAVPQSATAGRALTILAVDDDAIILMNTAALLEDLGHHVLEADSGDAALALFRAHPEIELIITDFAMPGMTGLELAEQASAERPGTPIVLATGYGEMPSAPSLRLQRLGKPFNQADLKAAIAEIASSDPPPG